MLEFIFSAFALLGKIISIGMLTGAAFFVVTMVSVTTQDIFKQARFNHGQKKFTHKIEEYNR